MSGPASSATKPMRLADFILANTEPILRHWEAFALSIWPAHATNTPERLRDDAEDILKTVVADMSSEQTRDEQLEKSKGRGRPSVHSDGLDQASHRHGTGRVDSGFRLKELIAEYRALRASVLRLWRDSLPVAHAEDLADMTRFHEAIDQSLAQAVESFTDRIDQSRRLFLAILGHDLRNPLNAMTMSAQMLALSHGSDSEVAQTAAQVSTSASAMQRMINDLLDFTAAGVGGSMPLSRTDADLGAICREVIREIQVGNPQCNVHFEASGELSGRWDEQRLRQVISNLLGNAVQHGSYGCDVDMTARGEGEEVVLRVRNEGIPIPPTALDSIFDPLRRVSGSQRPGRRGESGMGLGLYITQQIIAAHHGRITVSSSVEEGTIFTVRLPRSLRED